MSAHASERNAEPDMAQPRARTMQSRRRHRGTAPSTPARSSRSVSPGTRPSRLHVYDDSLPAGIQPVTPQNLPEARHQSRLQGAYTMPAGRGTPLEVPTPTTNRPWHRGAGRNPTPAGLQTPGFLGLYGGIENGDEVALFEQAERAVEGRAARLDRSSSFGFQ
jgi:hypothetical protein